MFRFFGLGLVSFPGFGFWFFWIWIGLLNLVRFVTGRFVFDLVFLDFWMCLFSKDLDCWVFLDLFGFWIWSFWTFGLGFLGLDRSGETG
jgi:hypothetical protein